MAETVATRYAVPSSPLGEGWALLFIDGEGAFAAITDYGNFSHRWSSRAWGGVDFRHFLLTVSADYLARKLAGGATEYRGELTAVAARDLIIQMRREATRNPTSPLAISAGLARAEWCLIDACGDLRTEDDFAAWCKRTSIKAPESMAVQGTPRRLTAFIENAWPRLRRALELDLTFEGLGVAVADAAGGVRTAGACPRCTERDAAVIRSALENVPAQGGVQ